MECFWLSVRQNQLSKLLIQMIECITILLLLPSHFSQPGVFLPISLCHFDYILFLFWLRFSIERHSISEQNNRFRQFEYYNMILWWMQFSFTLCIRNRIRNGATVESDILFYCFFTKFDQSIRFVEWKMYDSH